MKLLKLLKSNSHYFEYDGKPTLLIGSGEHYGAVLNLDFDYVRYLDAMAKSGLNLTRTFCGTYRESPASFNICNNPLAPKPGRFCCAWEQVNKESDNESGEIYDLARFSEEHAIRLRDFLAQAEKRGIFVELVLFCYLYNDELWQLNPMHPDRNTDSTGAGEDRLKTFDPDNAPLLAVQKELTRKIVSTCNEFGNVYYEIMNEPYSLSDGRDYDRWQNIITDTIIETEKTLPNKHLIARNYQNRTMIIENVHPGVSILNFHYAEPSSVHNNFHLNLPVADDETGFKGQTDMPYRQEAWRFMLSGGAAFSHLDYSFTTDTPDGTAEIKSETPGGGGTRLRRQFAILKNFMEQLPFEKMRPADEAIKFQGPHMPDGSNVNILSDGTSAWAIYLTGGPSTRLPIGLPGGKYKVKWIRPADGQTVREEKLDHKTAVAVLQSPLYSEDIALTITAQ